MVEPGRVYVHFGSFGTACLDTHTGKTLWKSSLFETAKKDQPLDNTKTIWLVADSRYVFLDFDKETNTLEIENYNQIQEVDSLATLNDLDHTSTIDSIDMNWLVWD